MMFLTNLTAASCVYQDHNLDWFPRMRAMSLVSSDADGEQNEIRSLQEKLESTMKLVSNLSGQLTELKEQVGSNMRELFLSLPPHRGGGGGNARSGKRNLSLKDVDT